MAQVTVELRQLLQLSEFELFDFPYTFNDLVFKAKLEQAVIDYYYSYEIGFETPDEFKRRFQTKWMMIIDYYNQLYNTTLLTYNPLTNYTLTEALTQLATTENVQDSTATTTANGTTIHAGTDVVDQTTSNNSTRTDNMTSTTGGSSTATTNEKTSDYPQAGGQVGNYLDGARDSTTVTDNDTTTANTGTQGTVTTATNDSTTTADSTTTNDDSTGTTGNIITNGTQNTNYEKTIEGLTGTSYQELIRQERQNILNIIPQVVSELKQLFILVY